MGLHTQIQTSNGFLLSAFHVSKNTVIEISTLSLTALKTCLDLVSELSKA